MDIGDMNRIFEAGGAKAIDFLNYCIISSQIDPLFVYLVEKEYRTHSSKKRARALYDVFCAEGAPLRVNADQALPPTDKTLVYDMQSVGLDQILAQDKNVVTRKVTAVFGARKPEKGMFDEVVNALRGNDSSLTDACSKYDPDKGALGSLGGEMTTSQRNYVRTSWIPVARPKLVAAKFKIVLTLCGGGS